MFDRTFQNQFPSCSPGGEVPHASSLLVNMDRLRQVEKLCDVWLEV